MLNVKLSKLQKKIYDKMCNETYYEHSMLPRKSGVTTVALQFASKYASMYENKVAYIVRNIENRKYALELLKKHQIFHNFPIYTVYGIPEKKLNYNIIILDGAKYYSDHGMQLIYKRLKNQNTFQRWFLLTTRDLYATEEQR